MFFGEVGGLRAETKGVTEGDTTAGGALMKSLECDDGGAALSYC